MPPFFFYLLTFSSMVITATSAIYFDTVSHLQQTQLHHTTDSGATLDFRMETHVRLKLFMLDCRPVRADRRRIVPIRAMTFNGRLVEGPDGEMWVYGTTQKPSNGRRSGRAPSPPR
jgi:hypothetical protein